MMPMLLVAAGMFVLGSSSNATRSNSRSCVSTAGAKEIFNPVSGTMKIFSTGEKWSSIPGGAGYTTTFELFPKGGAPFDLNDHRVTFDMDLPRSTPKCDQACHVSDTMKRKGCENNGGRVNCKLYGYFNMLKNNINATTLPAGSKVATCLCVENAGMTNRYCVAGDATVVHANRL